MTRRAYARPTAQRPGDRWRWSGGTLRVPKTDAERLALYLRMRRLKTEFLRREAERDG